MKCSVTVNGQFHRGIGFQPHPCRYRGPTVKRNGKWYCGQHDPVRLEARAKEYAAAYAAAEAYCAANEVTP